MFFPLSFMHVREQEEDPAHTDLILKFSETKLWNDIYVKNKTGHFGIEILVINIANNRIKECLTKMESPLPKIHLNILSRVGVTIDGFWIG
jgi:hypothetical protein